MTTLYRPVLIESAEQAEALPEGSVVPVEDKDGPWEKRPDGKFQGAGRVVVDAYRVLDRIALVPIEIASEDEDEEHGILSDRYSPPDVIPVLGWEPGSGAARLYRRTIFSTPWEAT